MAETGNPDDALTARGLDLLRAEVDDLFARHEQLATDHRRRGDERTALLRDAMARDRDTEHAEEQAWQSWQTARDQQHEQPGDLALLAATDQAEAEYDTARETALRAHAAAGALARRLLEESEQDTRELLELGRRARAAQDSWFEATQRHAAETRSPATASPTAGDADG